MAGLGTDESEGWKDLILGSHVSLHLSDSTDLFLSCRDPETHIFIQEFAYKWDLALSWCFLALKWRMVSITQYKAWRTTGKIYGTRKEIAFSLWLDTLVVRLHKNSPQI